MEHPKRQIINLSELPAPPDRFKVRIVKSKKRDRKGILRTYYSAISYKWVTHYLGANNEAQYEKYVRVNPDAYRLIYGEEAGVLAYLYEWSRYIPREKDKRVKARAETRKYLMEALRLKKRGYIA